MRSKCNLQIFCRLFLKGYGDKISIKIALKLIFDLQTGEKCAKMRIKIEISSNLFRDCG
jgi:hypothetical protein